MYWCGFNGFNQLNHESKTNQDFHMYDDKGNNGLVQQVTFSWSTASILTSIGFKLCNLYFGLMNFVYLI